MKKALFLLLVLFAACKVSQKVAVQQKPVSPSKIDYTQIGAPMPDMVLVTFDSIKSNARTARKAKRTGKDYRFTNNIYTNADFKNDANLFVMVFNPTCSHCMEETENLKRNISLFKKSKLILIANKATKDYIADFIKQRNTAAFPTMKVGIDSNNYIPQVYLYGPVPQINIYNPERKLIKTFQGDVPIDSLRSYIQ
jgi:hypothetical protein